MIFESKVDESEVGKIQPGMDLVLTVGAIEGQTFDATLEHIAPKGGEEDGAIQFQIRAALAQRDGVLIRADYSANADIVLARTDEVLCRFLEPVLELVDAQYRKTRLVIVGEPLESSQSRRVELGLRISEVGEDAGIEDVEHDGEAQRANSSRTSLNSLFTSSE